MVCRLLQLLSLVALLELPTLAAAQKIKDRIYQDIPAIRPCFRRLNSSGEVGCSSGLGGNAGVLLVVESEADLEQLQPGQFSPYIVLLSPARPDLLAGLRQTGQVAGVILPAVTGGRWEGQYPQRYSDDSACPNQRTGDDSTCSPAQPWNPAGQDAMWTDWGFPVFLVEDTSQTDLLYNCSVQYNSAPLAWPLCSVEMKAHMYGAKDSQTCLRRSNLFSIAPVTVCDPLSDDNIFHFARERPVGRAEAEKSILVVAARLDALALFDQVEVGFDSPATGIVTLLTVAKLVSEHLRGGAEMAAGVENVLFLLLHGESFQYIGSSRLVHDMKSGSWPGAGNQSIDLTKVKSLLELGQLAPRGQTPQLYLHTQNAAGDMAAALQESAGALDVKAATGAGLPPASAQSFLQERDDLPSLLISNYDRQFSNPMYHSVYDSAAYHNYTGEEGGAGAVAQHLDRVAAMVAGAVLKLATGQSASNLSSQADLVDSLLQCFTLTANCDMFYQASEPGNFPWNFHPSERPRAPFPQYVGVRSSYHTLKTRQVLQYLTGTVVKLEAKQEGEQAEEEGPDSEEEKRKQECNNKNQDQHEFSYVYLVGKDCYAGRNSSAPQCGKCYRTTVSTSPAASPIMDSYASWDSSDTSQFPTWTESIWKVIEARMFLKGNPATDHGIFATGVIISLASFLLVFWVNKNAEVLFAQKSLVEVDNPVPVQM